MKNKGISKLVAVAPLVLTPLVFTSCKPATATTIVIKGSSLLNGAPLVAGKVYFEADTDTGDNISNEVDWSLNGDEPEWVSIDSEGIVSWTNAAVAGEYQFMISATKTGLTSNPLTVVLRIDATPASEVIISQPSGGLNILAATSYAGSYQLTAYTDTGVNITTSANWKITSQYDWITIDEAKGIIFWTAQNAEDTPFPFTVEASMDTLKTGSLSVTLTFNKQNGTSITISGPNADKNITGAISYSGSYQLKAYTDTGVDVTNQATWAITSGSAWITINQTTGLVSWVAQPTEGVYAFSVSASVNHLTTGTLSTNLELKQQMGTSVSVFGQQDIYWTSGYAGASEKYQAWTNTHLEVTSTGEWHLSYNAPTWVHLNNTDNKGLLYWDEVTTTDSYSFDIWCEVDGLSYTKLTIELYFNSLPPDQTSTTTYGPNNIDGVYQEGGSTNYQASDNLGVDLTTNSTWTVSASFYNDQFSINNNGILSWTNNIPIGNYVLQVTSTYGDFTSTKYTNFNVYDTAKPSSTAYISGPINLDVVSTNLWNFSPMFLVYNNNGLDLTSLGNIYGSGTDIDYSITSEQDINWLEIGAYGTLKPSRLTDLPTNGLFAITIHAQITGNYSFTLTKNIYLNILPSTANYIFQSFPEQIYLDKNNIFVDPSKPVGWADGDLVIHWDYGSSLYLNQTVAQNADVYLLDAPSFVHLYENSGSGSYPNKCYDLLSGYCWFAIDKNARPGWYDFAIASEYMGYKDIDIISLYVVDTREITSVSIAGCNNVDTKGDNTSGSSNYLAYDNMGNNVTSSGTWSLGPSAPEGVNISNHGILTYSNVKAGNYIFDINFSYAGKAVSYRIEFLAHKLW